jgi:soluble lytic murein transglycosylase-like protein
MKFVLTAAGAGMLMLFSLVFVLADQASANDGPTCGTTTGFLPKLCLSIPLPATVRRDNAVRTTIAQKQTVTAPADIAPRTDVVIEPGAASDVLAPAANFATGSDTPSEPELAAPEARALERVFDIADLRAYARDAAIRHGIDPVLFVRQITAESEFDPNAVSKAGAVGIAQIMPALHPAVDPTDPYASLDYAARLMRGYIVHFGSWRLALIAYNAGPGRLMPGNRAYLPTATLLSDSFGGGETKRYVARILGR